MKYFTCNQLLTINDIKQNLLISLYYNLNDHDLLNELIEKVVYKIRDCDYKTYYRFDHILYKNEIIDRYYRIKKIDKIIESKYYKL